MFLNFKFNNTIVIMIHDKIPNIKTEGNKNIKITKNYSSLIVTTVRKNYYLKQNCNIFDVLV